MTREEEIKQYCEEMGFPMGSCSSINSVKAQTAADAIRWADKNPEWTKIAYIAHQLNGHVIDWAQVRVQAAIAAMQGILYDHCPNGQEEAIANECVCLADALVKELKGE